MTEAEQAIGTPEPEKAEEAGASAEPAKVEEAGASAEPGTTGGRGERRILVLLAVAAVAYLLDLSTKIIVVSQLEHEGSIDVLGSWLRFEVVRNRGAAFGLGEAMTIVFTCIAAIVIVVIARIARKLYSVPWAIALGMLLGGALGNLTDRLFRTPGGFKGAVVDFIAPANFAVFNLADSAIVCGGITIVILSFRGLDPDGTVHPH
ncbi:signal peptidase II [Streptomyces zagrosensis]|uniref:Lipoprotein signal peptidase n=1 Tax=Streptomyces zagrosensis TaxID=1042984 RepID=A0A7W9UXA1_9ACTN|nr:signal peptidase II [Streptomyces zagrosensis]MBB5933494.1 signal peptidase II [Streptomyces zagrosensis]